jgi:hypothetical protein
MSQPRWTTARANSNGPSKCDANEPEDSAGDRDHGSTSRVLWHAYRPHSPAVTARLTSTPTGQYELQVTLGTAALRRVPFCSDVAAIERAERLLAQLETRGYQRTRWDKIPIHIASSRHRKYVQGEGRPAVGENSTGKGPRSAGGGGSGWE